MNIQHSAPSTGNSARLRPERTRTLFYRLTRIHRSLDDAISREMTRLLPDSLKLLRLKKLRLKVKDRLTGLMRRSVAA